MRASNLIKLKLGKNAFSLFQKKIVLETLLARYLASKTEPFLRHFSQRHTHQ